MYGLLNHNLAGPAVRAEAAPAGAVERDFIRQALRQGLLTGA